MRKVQKHLGCWKYSEHKILCLFRVPVGIFWVYFPQMSGFRKWVGECSNFTMSCDSDSEAEELRQVPTLIFVHILDSFNRATPSENSFRSVVRLICRDKHQKRADAHVIVIFSYRKWKRSFGGRSERVQPLHSTGHLRKFPDLDPSILYRISFD